MNAINRETVRHLLNGHEPPCLSIYMPTHRHHPDNQQDPIRFKNLVRDAEESLLQKYRGRDIRPVMKRLEELVSDGQFWRHTLDGLAVLASEGTFQPIRMPRRVEPLVVVADRFHLKPLLRHAQSADRYQVLALTRTTAKMYEGDRYTLEPLPAPDGFPGTLTAALGEVRTEASRTVRSLSGPGGIAMHHGQGGRMDEIDKDTERFFRVVDQEVAARFSKPTGLPLLLAALPEHHAPFRAVAQNPALLPGGLEGNPDAMTADELRVAAWAALEPYYLTRLGNLCEEFTTAQAHQRGSADLSDVARAAAAGRVATLLVEADRVIPGRKDPATGAVALAADLSAPDVGDVLEDVAEAVLRTGGDVVIVPKERMPVTSGMAATFRF